MYVYRYIDWYISSLKMGQTCPKRKWIIFQALICREGYTTIKATGCQSNSDPGNNFMSLSRCHLPTGLKQKQVYPCPVFEDPSCWTTHPPSKYSESARRNDKRSWKQKKARPAVASVALDTLKEQWEAEAYPILNMWLLTCTYQTNMAISKREPWSGYKMEDVVRGISFQHNLAAPGVSQKWVVTHPK